MKRTQLVASITRLCVTCAEPRALLGALTFQAGSLNARGAEAADGPRPGRHLRGWPTQTRDGCEASARVLSGPQTGEGTRLGRNEILAHLDLRCPFRPVQLLYPKCYRPSCCSGSRRTHCSLYLGLDRRSPPVFRPASRPTPQTAQKVGLRGQDEATVFGFETSGATSGATDGFER